MDYALVMRVLNGFANGYEQLQPLPDRQFGIVAVLDQRKAFDILHGEIRATLIRHPAIEHAGDVRVVHHSQGLPLGFESREHGLGVHSQLDQFDAASGHPMIAIQKWGAMRAEHYKQLVQSGQMNPDDARQQFQSELAQEALRAGLINTQESSSMTQQPGG